jgi:hypothetical protein
MSKYFTFIVVFYLTFSFTFGANAQTDVLNNKIKLPLNQITNPLISGGNPSEIDAWNTSYTFSTSAGTWTALSSPTVLWSGSAINNVTASVTIPSFMFNGTAYTNAYVSSNGFITFGSAPSTTEYTPISSSATYTGAISAFGSTLQYQSTSTSVVSYKDLTASSEFVIEFKDMRRKNYSNDKYSFQIRLNYSNGSINIVYGYTGSLTFQNDGENNPPQVGLRGTSNSDYNNLRVQAGGNWNSPNLGTANNHTLWAKGSEVTVPTSGRTYTWSPPITFYSKGNLDPATASNWNTARNGSGTNATSSDFTTGGRAFVIQNTHNMTTASTWSLSGTGSKLWIENGGTLTASNAVTLSSNTTFQIDGGGTYIHNNTSSYSSTIFQGTESFAATSTVELRNSNTTGPSSVTFGNLTVNFTSTPSGSVNCSGGITTINGNLNIQNTSTVEFRITGTTSTTLAVNGDFIQSGGTFNFASGSGGTQVLNLYGNYSQTGGTHKSDNSVTYNFRGSSKTISNTGTLTSTNISFVIYSGASYTLTSNYSSVKAFTVTGSLEFGNNAITGSGGTFTTSSGSTIILGSPDGISSSGSSTGNIQTTGTRSFNSGTNVTFNGTLAQITGTGFLTSMAVLTISNSSGVTLSAALTTTNIIINTGTLFDVSTSNFDLNVAGNWNNSGTFTPRNGTVTFTGSTKTITNSAGETFNNLTINSGGTSLASNCTVSNILTLTSGTFSIAANTLTLNGPAISGTLSNLSTTTSSNLVFGGSSSGILIPGGLSLNNLTINNANGITHNGSSSSNTINGILALTGGNYSIASNTLVINGSVSGTSSITGSSNSNLSVTGSGTAITLPSISGGLNNFIINRTNGVTLGSGTSVTGVLTLTSGKLFLANYDLTLGASATVSGTPSSSNMVVADNSTGTGQFKKTYGTSVTNFLFPIGDNLGNYSPTAFNLNVNSTTRTFGVQVKPSANPNLPIPLPSDYINRYWKFTLDDTTGNFTYSSSFRIVPGDVAAGYADSMGTYFWKNSSWTILPGSYNNNLFSNSFFTDNAPVSSYEFTCYTATSVTYTWLKTDGGTYDFNDGNNWSPSRSAADARDILSFSSGGSSVVINTPTQTVSSMIFSNNTSAIMRGTISDTLAFIKNAGALNIASGSELSIDTNLTIAFSGTNVISSISGSLNILYGSYNALNSNTVISGTGIVNNYNTFVNANTTNTIFQSGSKYIHMMNNGVVPSATYNSGSFIIVRGITSAMPSSFPQNVGNLIWNCTSQTVIGQIPNITSISNTFTDSSNGTGAIYFNTASSQTISQNFDLINGTFIVAGSSSNQTVSVTGNFNNKSGILDIGSGSGNGTLSVTGTFTVDASGSIIRSGSSSGSTITFNGSSGTSVIMNGSTLKNSKLNSTSKNNPIRLDASSDRINYMVNNGINLTGNINVNDNSTVTIAGGNISGGTVTYSQTGTTLQYTGTSAQISGTEFPDVNGPVNLTINKTGTGSANRLTLNSDKTMSGTGILTLTAGVINLSSYDMTLGTGMSISVTSPGSTRMIAASGSGQLKKIFPVGSSGAFIFPIGDLTGPNYTPASLTLTANSDERTLGYRVVNSLNPNVDPSKLDWINRYWVLSNNLSTGNFSYTGTFTCVSGDINGNPTVLKKWNGTSWSTPSATYSSFVYTINTAENENPPVASYEFTAFNLPLSYYYKDIGTVDFTNLNNWWSNSDGTGVHPANFTNNAQYFYIIAQDSINYYTLNSGWGITGTNSKLTIGNGTNGVTFVIPASAAYTGNGIYVTDLAKLKIANTSIPAFGTLSSGSTIEYSGTAAQTITATTYQNLVISNIFSPGGASTGGTFTVNGNLTVDTIGILTANNAITIASGKTFYLNGTYRHNNTTSVASTIFAGTEVFSPASTFEILNWNTSNPDAVWHSSLSTFTYNSLPCYYGNLKINWTLTSNFTASAVNNTYLCAGNFTQNTAGTANAFRLFNTSSTYTVSIGGDLILTNSYFYINNNGGGNVNLYGNFIFNNSRISTNSSTGMFYFLKSNGTQYITPTLGSSSQTSRFSITVGSSSPVSNTTVQLNSNFVSGSNTCSPLTVTVNPGSTLNLNNYNLEVYGGGGGTPTATINGTLKTGTGALSYSNTNFTFSSGANSILELGSPQGIVSSTSSGNIRTTGSCTFTTGTTFIYNGTSAQVTGTRLPGSLANLVIDNSAGVTLSQNATVGGVLTLTNGDLVISNRTLTLMGTLSGPGTLTGSSSSNLSIVSSGAIGTVTFTSGAQVLNTFTVNIANTEGSKNIKSKENNSELSSPNVAGTVTLGTPLSVTSFVLTAGTLYTSNTNLLTVTGTTQGSVNYTAGNVDGPMARTLPANLSTGTTYKFPLGKSAYTPFELIDATTTSGGSVVIQAEVFDSNCGGSAGTNMSTLNSNRYWFSSITSGSGNFINSKIKLTDPGIGTADAIAQSTTLTGAYDKISTSPPSANSITTDVISSLNYFVFGIQMAMPLNGTYTVGTVGCDYTTLTAAINSLNSRGVAAPVTFTLNNTTGEIFPITINSFTGNGPLNPVTIKPASSVTISGSSSTGLIIINAADNITIDGSNSGGTDRSMTFENTSSSAGAYVLGVSNNGANLAVNNMVKNCVLKGNGTSSASGINAAGTTSLNITNNEIYSTSAGEGTNSQYGIKIGAGSIGTIIKNNQIHDLSNTTGCFGIYYNSDATTVTEISNNLIYLITSNGSSTLGNSAAGIYVASGGNCAVYYNSIYLSGTSSTGITAGIGIETGTSLLNIRNNVFRNAITGGTNSYGIYSNSANTAFTTIDYNVYFADGTGANVGYLGTNCLTISDWKTVTGQDLNSSSGNPGFISVSNLLPDTTSSSCWILNGKGMPVTDVSVDYRGLNRSTAVTTGPTDIGAYEFSTLTNPPSALESRAPTASDTTTYWYAGRKLVEIKWGATFSKPTVIRTDKETKKSNTQTDAKGKNNVTYKMSPNTLPATVNVQYYSGVLPPDTTTPHNSGYSFWYVKPNSDPADPYDITVSYGDNELGKTGGASNMCLAKYDSATRVWVPFDTTGAYSGANCKSIIDPVNKTIKVKGLTGFGVFTITSLDQPLNRLLLDITVLIEGLYYDGGFAGYQVLDTVSVIFRDSTNAWARVDSLLVPLDSLGHGRFFTTKAKPGAGYYLVIKHRNALETWSSLGNKIFGLSTGLLSYNFTTSQDQAYGNNLLLKNSVYCIYSGDCADADGTRGLQDGLIDANDMAVVDNDAFNYLSGWEVTDLNGDLLIDLNDMALIDNNAGNYIQLIRPPDAPDKLVKKYYQMQLKVKRNIIFQDKKNKNK